MTEKRIVYYDVIRCIAVFMVLFNHSVSAGFMAFANCELGTIKQFVYLMNSILSKCGVPLFFMVSGALLLGKDESIHSILKRFFRFLIVLIVASVITYLWSWKVGGYYETISVKGFIEILYTGRHATAYWFLYTYLMYILMLPFLRSIVKSISVKESLYILCIYVAIKLMPVVDYLVWEGDLSHNEFINVFITVDYVLFPIVGYAVETIFPRFYSKSFIIILCIISLAVLAFEAGLTKYRCEIINSWTEADCQYFFNTFVLIPSAAIMIVSKKVFEKTDSDSKLGRFITLLGSVTFGVYLFERIWRHTTTFIYWGLKDKIPSLIACYVWLLSSIVLGGAVTFFIKRIPVINKFI